MEIEFREVTLIDINQIHKIEKSVEGENAASKKVLIDRKNIFPQGFYVAISNKQIIGYIESCRWNLLNFQTFDEIKDFKKYHDPNGTILYVIFLAVDEIYRKQGIGSDLLKVLEKEARVWGIKKIQLVAKEGLIPFYHNLGFKVRKQLPHFLAYKPGVVMEKELK